MRSISTRRSALRSISVSAILVAWALASIGKAEQASPRLAFLTFDAGARIPGLRCTIPRPFWNAIGTEHFISDVPGETPQPDIAAMARANVEALSAQDSPLTTFCQPGGDTVDSWGGLATTDHVRTNIVQPWSSTDPDKHPRAGQLTYFGLSELAWAVIRNDRPRIPGLVRRTPDVSTWCGTNDGDNIARAADPLSLAIQAKNAFAVRSVVTRFRPSMCGNHQFSRLYERAFRDSLALEDRSIASSLLRGYGPSDLPRVAEFLNKAGETALAVEADSLVPPGRSSLIVSAVSRCDFENFAYWLKKADRRPNGRRAIEAAWQALSQPDDWRPSLEGTGCISIFERLIDRGHRLDPGSPLLLGLIAHDRSQPYGEKLQQIDAARIVAGFVRAGGRLDWNHNPPRRGPCQVRHVVRLVTGGDCPRGSDSEFGLTSFRSAIEEGFPEIIGATQN